MTSLNQRLYANYDRHYIGGKVSTSYKRQAFAAYSAQFGSLVRHRQQGRFLDIGCGTGLLLEWLSTHSPHFSLQGIDASPAIAKIAAGRMEGKAIITQADGIEFLHGQAGTFDGIFATDILEHMTDGQLEGFLDGTLKALDNGGFLAVKVPNMANFSATELRYRDATHTRGFTEKSLAQVFNAFGFSNVRCYGVLPHSLGMLVRAKVEHLFHRVVYRICGHTDVSIFTRTITAVGHKPAATP